MPCSHNLTLEADGIFPVAVRPGRIIKDGTDGVVQLQRKVATMKQRTTTKKKQEFGITAPTASSVMLVGDFTHWQEKPIGLKKQPDGRWATTVPLTPGTYHYRFLVDGQWCDDPECALVESNPYGTHDAVRQVA